MHEALGRAESQLRQRAVDQCQIRWNVTAVDVKNDRQGEVAESTLHGVTLCEIVTGRGVGAADEHGVGVVEPPSQSHPPRVAGNVDCTITAGLDVDDEPFGAWLIANVGRSPYRVPASIDTVSMHPPISRPVMCTSPTPGSSRVHPPGASRVNSI